MKDTNPSNDIRNFLKNKQGITDPVSKQGKDDPLLEDLWTLSEKAVESPDFDTDKAWQKFKVNNYSRNNTNSYIAILIAVLVLGALLSLSHLWIKKDSPPKASPAIAAQFNTAQELIDGSNISLFQAEDLELASGFSQLNRKVRLKGNAYCDIKSDPDHPFEIVTNNGLIRVYGTSFLVEQDEGILKVSVFEGTVEITHPENLSLICKITEGEIASLFRSEQVICHTNPDSEGITQIMSNTKLSDAISIFNRSTDYTIQLTKEKPDIDCRLTSRWNSRDINSWKEDLTLVFNATIEVLEDKILVSGLQCKQ